MKSFLAALSCVVLSSLLLACSSSDDVGSSVARLEPACVEDAAALEPTDWLCPASFTVECENGAGKVETVFVEPGEELSEQLCEELELSVNDPGPFPLGSHEIVVSIEGSDEQGDPLVEECVAELEVVDTEPPVAEARIIELWPPNHKMQTISIEDCANVDDDCDQDLDIYFLSAASDEPANDKGDGNTETDIILGCRDAQVRAERQGGGDGRVYTLSWRAVDDEGLEVEGTCEVQVPHDQSGEPAVAGEPIEPVISVSDCEQ